MGIVICEAALKALDVQELLYEIPLGRMRVESHLGLHLTEYAITVAIESARSAFSLGTSRSCQNNTSLSIES